MSSGVSGGPRDLYLVSGKGFGFLRLLLSRLSFDPAAFHSSCVVRENDHCLVFDGTRGGDIYIWANLFFGTPPFLSQCKESPSIIPVFATWIH